VASLYVFVPYSIRQLDRNDARQIRWRTFATSLVCFGAVSVYPTLFCKENKELLASGLLTLIMSEVESCSAVLMHTAVLYLGVFVQRAFQVRNYILNHAGGSFSLQEILKLYLSAYVAPIIRTLIKPRTPSERWTALRNVVIAPLTEEVVFRGCIVSAITTSLSLRSAILISPLFFGTAHFHHALVKLRQGEKPALVLLQTLLQFAYTTLFGIYTSYAYLQTDSLLAVILSHSFCNIMGLPDFSFVHKSSPLYKNRYLLLTFHVAGLGIFLFGHNRFI
jgi:prenyl protein peptidase